MPDRDTERLHAYAHMHDLGEVLARMSERELAAREAEEDVELLGRRARTLSASWQQIADSIGVTYQAARSRWSSDGDGRRARHRRLEHLRAGRDTDQVLRSQLEHERRFLLTDKSVVDDAWGYDIDQAYIYVSPAGYGVRVRWLSGVTPDGDAFVGQPTLTVKGPRSTHGSRVEVSMPLPPVHAKAMIDEAVNVIRKRRHVVHHGSDVWEVDIFKDANTGLVIAEFEGRVEQVRTLRVPQWCGTEVTNDRRYNNEYLATTPWPTWGRREEAGE